MILHIEYDNCGATGCRIVKHAQLSTNGQYAKQLNNAVRKRKSRASMGMLCFVL